MSKSKWRLKELMAQFQLKTGESLTYIQISQETGISISTLSDIGTRKAKRAEIETIDKLLDFFSIKLGKELEVTDLLSRRGGEGQGDD